MNEEDLLYTLALQKASKIGDITAKKMIQYCGSPKEIFFSKASSLQTINGVGTNLTHFLKDKLLLKAAEKELKYIQDNQLKTYYFEDENYPSRLKNCIDGPILLFGAGNIDLQKTKIISIVGTRNITSHGKAFCEQLVEDLSILNPLIISGFAYGVDITVHKAAIKNKLQNIGCLAHGLNQIYPKVHKKYMHQVEENGGFLTEFWSTSSPERENFIKRNRIIAGISEATIVIESAAKGGSLITADIANSYNREVFAVSGRPTDIFSEGCNNLIKQQKAQLISSAADVIYMLNWDVNNQKQKVIQPQLFFDLTETEEKIIAHLKKHGKAHLDAIAIACQIPIYSLSGTLLNLELKGILRPHPGKYFEIIGY